MQKVVTGLCGHADCGKSTTLTKLQEKLKTLGEYIYQESHDGETVKIFRYKDTIIGIAPGGDSRDVIEKNIRIFKEQKCDICVSATRTGGKGCDALEEYAKELTGKGVRWFRMPYMNEYVDLYNTVQEGVADAILACIERRIARHEN